MEQQGSHHEQRTLLAVTKSVGRCSLTPLAAAVSTRFSTIFEPSSSNSDLPICGQLRERRQTNLHSVDHLLECKRHAAADDHLVHLPLGPRANMTHLVQQTVDQLDLVRDLRAAEDGKEGARGRLQRLSFSTI